MQVSEAAARRCRTLLRRSLHLLLTSWLLR
jgi:hypothetical protein